MLILIANDMYMIIVIYKYGYTNMRWRGIENKVNSHMDMMITTLRLHHNKVDQRQISIYTWQRVTQQRLWSPIMQEEKTWHARHCVCVFVVTAWLLCFAHPLYPIDCNIDVEQSWLIKNGGTSWLYQKKTFQGWMREISKYRMKEKTMLMICEWGWW